MNSIRSKPPPLLNQDLKEKVSTSGKSIYSVDVSDREEMKVEIKSYIGGVQNLRCNF